MSGHLVPGRIVLFVVDEESAAAIARRRTTSDSILERMQKTPPEWPAGAQAHMGYEVKAGDVVPSIVTCVHGPECVNLKVFLDGTDVLWVTSALLDAGTTPDPTPEVPSPVTTYTPRSWHWMFSGQDGRYTPGEDKLKEIATAIATDIVGRAFESHAALMHVPPPDALTTGSDTPTPALHLAAIKADLQLAVDNAKNAEAPYGVPAAYVGLVQALKVILNDWPTAE